MELIRLIPQVTILATKSRVFQLLEYQPAPSFSEMVQRERSASRTRIIKPQKTSALVIRPKTVNTHDEAKRKLVNEVTLRNLPVKHTKSSKRISNGGLVVETDSDNDIDQ
ncbi:hypothetical protein AVEN_119611-1 [Araneus ventricosus]|uniref:Uncharacterized protein n=1 Tax=Araneus ventricosus TaxID=182803 RepID=A0A4Y2SEV8_ARAVE|nr:hypothetical protein AVEN_119611-1 [Araneus ventricosus]